MAVPDCIGSLLHTLHPSMAVRDKRHDSNHENKSHPLSDQPPISDGHGLRIELGNTAKRFTSISMTGSSCEGGDPETIDTNIEEQRRQLNGGMDLIN